MTEDNIVKIIVAIIALTGTLLGIVVGYIGRSRKQIALETKREQKQSDQFERLFSEMDGIKKRLDTHNHYAERIGGIEKSIISVQKDIEYLKSDRCKV